MIQNIWKEKATSFVGLLILSLAISCYYFDWPREKSLLENGLEAAIGLALFLAKDKFLAILFPFLRKKLGVEDKK